MTPHVHDPGARFCPACGAVLEPRIINASEPERLACPRCGWIQYLDPKVVAGLIIERNGAVLLLRRAYDPLRGLWVFPSGYVDRGEKVEEAAAREAREETGLDPLPREFLGVYSYEGSPVIVLVWLATASGNPAPGEEALEIAWFDADSIPWTDLAFPSTRDALEDWVELRGRAARRTGDA